MARRRRPARRRRSIRSSRTRPASASPKVRPPVGRRGGRGRANSEPRPGGDARGWGPIGPGVGVSRGERGHAGRWGDGLVLARQRTAPGGEHDAIHPGTPEQRHMALRERLAADIEEGGQRWRACAARRVEQDERDFGHGGASLRVRRPAVPRECRWSRAGGRRGTLPEQRQGGSDVRSSSAVAVSVVLAATGALKSRSLSRSRGGRRRGRRRCSAHAGPGARRPADRRRRRTTTWGRGCSSGRSFGGSPPRSPRSHRRARTSSRSGVDRGTWRSGWRATMGCG